MLLLALPLVSALLIGRSRYRLALVRTVNPQLVAAGQPASVSLSLDNAGRSPTGLLLLEDQVPYVLGTRPRFVLDRIGRGWHRDVTYQVRSDVRGRFEIGPLTVRLSDPFGLVELGRAFRTTRPADRHAAHRAAARTSRSAAPGPARATTGPARSRRPAPRTSPSASTAAATTCAACTGAARPASAS